MKMEQIFVKVAEKMIGPFANTASAYFEQQKIGGDIVRVVVES